MGLNYYRNGNGVTATMGKLDLPEITQEEYEAAVKAVENEAPAKAETAYWASVNYDDAVNTEIRKKYSESQEFAILRQKDVKTEEYDAYYAYCEECKELVKAKKATTEETA